MYYKNHFKKLEKPQEQQMQTPLEVGETADWCNSFVAALKPSEAVQLSLDQARLNQALI